MPVMDKLSSEEIIKIAEKVKQNEKETHDFSESFRKYTNGELRESDILLLGETPYSLQISGAKALPLNVTQLTLKNAMNPENVVMKHHTSGHDLDRDTIIKLPELLREPVLIIQDKDSKNLTAVLDAKDKQDRNIICRITLDKQESQYIVNRLSSMYGKRELADYLSRAFSENRVVSMHKEKAGTLLHSIGCQSPKENTITSFDNSIAYSMANVKYPEKLVPEQTHFKEIVSHDKLLPFLNAKAEFHKMRLASLKEKRETRTQKIAKNEAKIAKLTERAERLEDINSALALMTHIPAFKQLIEYNQKKIDTIRNRKTPNRESKAAYHRSRIAEIDQRSALIGHKLERVVALNDTISSFTLIGKERRERFANAMDRLNESTLNCLTDRKNTLSVMIENNKRIYDSSLPSAEDKLDIQKRINKMQTRLDSVEAKIARLSQKNVYAEKNAEDIDSSMINTANVINKITDGEDIKVPSLAEGVCLSDKDENYLANAEMSMEANYNNIDGIINNLPNKEDEIYIQDLANKGKTIFGYSYEHNDGDQIFSDTHYYKFNADNGKLYHEYIDGWSIDSNYIKEVDPKDFEKVIAKYDDIVKQAELTKAQRGGYSIDTKLEPNVRKLLLMKDITALTGNLKGHKEWLDKLISIGKAEVNDNGMLKINATYYKALGKNDRQIYEFPKENAEILMGQLFDKGIEFSAVSRANGNIAITVSKEDSHSVSHLQELNRRTDLDSAERFRESQQKNNQRNDPENTAAAAITQLKKLFFAHNNEGQALMSVEGAEYKNYYMIDKESFDKAISADKSERPFRRFLDIGKPISEVEYAEIQQSDKFTFSLEMNLDDHSAEIYTVNNGKGGISEGNRTDDNISIKRIDLLEEKAAAINPEYYKSLSTSKRIINTISAENAQNVMKQLEGNNIPYSAIQKGDCYKITVSKDNIKAFNAAVKQSEIRYINPEYYKNLDKNDRFTQRMGEDQAKKVIAELDKRGVEHSAVLNGKRSAVTIDQNDVKKAKDVRGFLKKQAQKIHRSAPSKTVDKSKDKGVDID